MKTWLSNTLIKRVIINDIAAATLPPWMMGLLLGGDIQESNSKSETYSDLTNIPVFREWIGARKAYEITDQEVVVKNKKFEATTDFLKDWFRFEKIKLIDSKLGMFPRRSVQHWLSELFALVKDGKTTTCIDKQFFFDTDHPVGQTSATYSNKITVDISELPVAQHGTVTVPSVSEMAWVINRAIQQLMSFPDDFGEPMNEMLEEFLLMVPLTLQPQAAAAVAGNDLPITDGSIEGLRAMKKRITVVGTPRLSSWTDELTLFALDAPQKPFILQQVGDEVEATSMGEGSEYEHKYDRHQYGVMQWRGKGYAAPQSGVHVTMV
ncbi:MAG TPA: Mu-like prophage major head subunit gpT family protein [Candidatus Binatia bacterium]|nr:Mu-like prophage major head subunit gpT family protein [Candidatus Binatia bacterium]